MWNVWNRFPFVRISLLFGVGIYVSEFVEPPKYYHYVLLSCLLGIHLFLYRQKTVPQYKLTAFSSLPFYFLIILLGVLISHIRDPVQMKSHYSHIKSQMEGWSGQVIKPGVEKANFILYQVRLSEVFVEDSVVISSGLINFYVKRDSANALLRFGDQVLVRGSPFEIPSPKNPHEFDYSHYMRLNSIYDQQFVKRDEFRVIDSLDGFSITKLAYSTRSFLQEEIIKHLGTGDRASIFAALSLGIKDYLDNDIKSAYASAGAMHVLAVSGLHVGIIFLMLNTLFRPLQAISGGKWIIAMMQIVVLWGYALITGFSPSVLRAVTMFTTVLIAQASNRKSNIYNTIALSALILMLIEPNFIYSVGFQLSYAAVFGIIYLQPKIYNLWIPKYWVLDQAWNITAVSIAAQISTFPLGLYYFHQFPTYFFISNLVVIPMVSLLILPLGVLFLVSTFSPMVASPFGQVLSALLSLLNYAVSFTQSLPGSLIDWIYIDRIQTILIYIGALSTIFVFTTRNVRWFYLTILISGLYISYQLVAIDSQAEINSIMHYSVRNNMAMDLRNGLNSTLVSTEGFRKTELVNFQIEPHRLATFSHQVHQDSLFVPSQTLRDGLIAYDWMGTHIVHISKPIEGDLVRPIVCDELIISNNSISSLEELDNFEFQYLIIDGTNNRFKLPEFNSPKIIDLRESSYEFIIE